MQCLAHAENTSDPSSLWCWWKLVCGRWDFITLLLPNGDCVETNRAGKLYREDLSLPHRLIRKSLDYVTLWRIKGDATKQVLSRCNYFAEVACECYEHFKMFAATSLVTVCYCDRLRFLGTTFDIVELKARGCRWKLRSCKFWQSFIVADSCRGLIAHVWSQHKCTQALL